MENNQPIKIKVSDSGMEGQAVNPFENQFTGGAYNSGHSKEYWDFDKANPSRPLTTAQTPNSIVEGIPIHECNIMGDKWVEIKETEIDYYQSNGYPTRQSFKPTEQTTTKRGGEIRKQHVKT